MSTQNFSSSPPTGTAQSQGYASNRSTVPQQLQNNTIPNQQPMFPNQQSDNQQFLPFPGSTQAQVINVPRSSIVSNRNFVDEETKSLTIKEKAKEFANETFQLNHEYLKSVRGILHIILLFLSMLEFSILAVACQVNSLHGSYGGFYCHTTESFIFVLSCNAFLLALATCVCCMFSKNSNEIIRRTWHEGAFYLTYCVCFLIGGLTMYTNVKDRNEDRVEKEYEYTDLISSSFIAILISIINGISCILFIFKRFGKKKEEQDQIINNPVPIPFLAQNLPPEPMATPSPIEQMAAPSSPPQSMAAPSYPPQSMAAPTSPTQPMAPTSYPTQQKAATPTPTQQTAAPSSPTQQNAAPSSPTQQMGVPPSQPQQMATPSSQSQQKNVKPSNSA